LNQTMEESCQSSVAGFQLRAKNRAGCGPQLFELLPSNF
jgi:hypothetical protein